MQKTEMSMLYVSPVVPREFDRITAFKNYATVASESCPQTSLAASYCARLLHACARVLCLLSCNFDIGTTDSGVIQLLGVRYYMHAP